MVTLRRTLGGVACAVLVLLATPAPGQRSTAALLRALDLAGYQGHERAPAFAGLTPDGDPLSLEDLRGRVVLVTFWASWCPPCTQQMSALEGVHRDLETAGLAVVGVNVREERSVILHYARAVPLTFPLVEDREGVIQASYGVIGLPSTFLIGRDGRAVARAIGPRDWASADARTLLGALLAEHGASR